MKIMLIFIYIVILNYEKDFVLLFMVNLLSCTNLKKKLLLIKNFAYS